MTSSRRGEPWYTQLRSWSLAVRRSIVLFTPKGLPQRMQQNGSSSLSTRAAAASGRKSSWGLRVITFSGQVALHSPHCTQASSVNRSIGRSGSSPSALVGQADTQERSTGDPHKHVYQGQGGGWGGGPPPGRRARGRRGAARGGGAASGCVF